MALDARAEPGSHAVLVVCDGVSNSVDSDIASLAAARAARDVLARSTSGGIGTAGARVAAAAKALEAAADAANDAVVANTVAGPAATRPRARSSPGWWTRPCSSSAGSATAVPTGSPRPGSRSCSPSTTPTPRSRSPTGVPRAEAETGPQAHAITRWLGSDSPDHVPHTASAGPGRARAGCWSARTACGTTAPSPQTWRRWCRSSTPTSPRTAGARRRSGRLGQRAGRHRQHHGGARPDRPTHPGREPRWPRSQLRSSRTSSSPTEAATCTRSSRSPAPGPARPAGPAPATPARSWSWTPPGSMGQTKIRAVQQAAAAALDQVHDGVWFAVIAGNHEARMAYPSSGPRAMVRMDDQARAAAKVRDRRLRPRRRDGHGHLAAAGHPGVRRHPGTGAEARDPADRRHQPARDPGAADRRHRGRPRPVPVRLPWRRRGLAGRGGTPDRHRPARQRRPDRRRRRTWPPTSSRSCASRWVAGSPRRGSGCGRPRVPRCCSCARSPPRSTTSPAGARRSTR